MMSESSVAAEPGGGLDALAEFAWASRFRRLVKDYERLPETLAGLHFVAFACLFLQQAAGILLTGS